MSVKESLEGTSVIIRTVGEIITGRVVEVTPSMIQLSDASWIADTGRWHDALRDGSLSEIEPYVDDVFVGRGSIVTLTAWRHELPREQV